MKETNQNINNLALSEKTDSNSIGKSIMNENSEVSLPHPLSNLVTQAESPKNDLVIQKQESSPEVSSPQVEKKKPNRIQRLLNVLLCGLCFSKNVDHQNEQKSGIDETAMSKTNEKIKEVSIQTSKEQKGMGKDLLFEDCLLPELKGDKPCLVLDLDETLVHSSFKIVENADFIVPVEIENQIYNVYVMKRPGVDEFLQRMGEIYEIVVFTASLAKYADPVLDILDVNNVVSHRLFRESCFNNNGSYVKDLSKLGRKLTKTIIIDNSPISYMFHPENALPVNSWFNDMADTELLDIVPMLETLSKSNNIVIALESMLKIKENSNITVSNKEQHTPKVSVVESQHLYQL